jgi:hypothetical protein
MKFNLSLFSPLEEIPLRPKDSSSSASDPFGNHASSDPFGNLDKILEPSPGAAAGGADSNLHPCPTCSRTFLIKALERHSKICEKMQGWNSPVFL